MCKERDFSGRGFWREQDNLIFWTQIALTRMLKREVVKESHNTIGFNVEHEIINL